MKRVGQGQSITLFMIPELWKAIRKETADHLGEGLSTRDSSFDRYIAGGGVLASTGFVEQLCVPHAPDSTAQHLLAAHTARMQQGRRLREAELTLKEIIAWLIIRQYDADGADSTNKVSSEVTRSF